MIRSAHTIKGSASLAGFPKLTQAAHWLETILNMVREDNLSPSDELLSILWELIVAISRLIHSIEDFGDEREVELSPIIAKATLYLKNATRKTGKLPPIKPMSERRYAVVISFENIPERIPAWLFAMLSKIQRVGEVVSSDPHIDSVLEGRIAPPSRIKLTIETTLSLDEIKELLRTSDGVRGVEVFEDEKGQKNRISFRVYLAEETPFKIARALLILQDLKKAGKIVSVNPPEEEIKKGALLEDRFFEVLLETEMKADHLRKLILRHPGVSDVRVVEGTLEHESKSWKISESRAYPPVFRTKRRTIPVDVSALDDLMYSLGELMALEEWFEGILSGTSDLEELSELWRRFSEVLSKLWNTVTSIRTTRLKEKIEKLIPSVKKLAEERGKRIDVVVKGEEVAVDRAVATVVWESLVHILRNAVIHGIEPPEERIRLGKPLRGIVEINIIPHPDYVEISVRDDGKGIDIKEVKKRAVERGIITPDEAKRLSKKEALMLIFKPGMSTEATVSTETGRGFGLSVVMEAVRSLHGSVHVASEGGVGTTVTLKVPSDILIIPTYIVEVNGKRYALPSVGVVGEFRLSFESIRKVGGLYVAAVGSGILPAIMLHDLVEFGALPGKELEGLLFQFDHDGHERILVLSDKILEKKETVVRSLRPVLQYPDAVEKSLFTGVTVLAGRELVPLLDLAKLMEEIVSWRR